MCHITTSPTKAPRPKWGVLNALVGVGLALLTVVDTLSPPGGWRTLTDCIALVVIFGTMGTWVRLNRVALAQADWCDCRAEQATLRVVYSRPVAQAVTQHTECVPLSLHVGFGNVHSAEGEKEECLVTSDQP